MNDEPQGAVTDRAEADAPRPDSGTPESRSDSGPPETTVDRSAAPPSGETIEPRPDGSSGEASGSPDGSGNGSTTTGAKRRRHRGSRGRGRSRSGANRPARGDDRADSVGDEDRADRMDDGTGGDGRVSAPSDGDAGGTSPAVPRTAPRARTRTGAGSGRPTAGGPAASTSSTDGGADKNDEAEAKAGAGNDDGPGSTATQTGTGTGAKRRRRRGSRGRGRSRSGGARPESIDGEPDGDEADSNGDEAPSVDATQPAVAAGEAEAGKLAGSRARSGAPRTRTPRARPAAAGADATEKTEGDSEESPEGADAETGEARLTTSAKRRRRRRSGARPSDGTDGDQAETGQDGAAAREPKPAPKRASRAKATAKATTDGNGEGGTTKRIGAAGTRTRTRTRPGGSRSGGGGDESGPTRTRRSRATMRRREPMPVVPRGTGKLMLITEHGDRDQIAVVEDRQLVEHYITRSGARSLVGNIYLGRVQNVLPGMEAAFIDIGKGRNAVLYAGEVSYDEDIGGRGQRIEQVLKAGQAALVQVTKDPIGGKGPRLTQEISLPGRYVVMVPNSDVFGISRRLPDNERRRLRAIIKKVHPEQHGVIVRTAAEGATDDDLAADLKRLAIEWEEISKKAKKAKAPHLLYEEPELTVRVVRDLFNDEEFKEIITDSDRVYSIVRDYLQSVAPELVEKVRMHVGKLTLFEQHHLIEQIHKALERKVWLPSGGYLVIDKTEAMTVIDVNTGKHVGKANLEDTVTKTNLEAAEEVARQLRLRDIGGMILIDFIDMLLDKNKREVIDTLKNAMAKDKTRSQVFDISPLGILEVTRKRVSGGLLDSFSETCPTCAGRGILITHEI